VREIAQAICGEFEVDEATALADTAEFVRQLLERKVLTTAAAAQAPRGPPAP
jgi:hypothetical protein